MVAMNEGASKDVLKSGKTRLEAVRRASRLLNVARGRGEGVGDLVGRGMYHTYSIRVDGSLGGSQRRAGRQFGARTAPASAKAARHRLEHL